MKRGGSAKKKRAKAMGGGMMKKRMKAVRGGDVKPRNMIKSFPDLSGDGKVTKKDVLMGRGVVKKGKREETRDTKPKSSKKPGGPPTSPRRIKPIRRQLQAPKDIRSTMKRGGSAKKDTHVTKDGRTVKKGLYYYMNRAKKRGTSKPGKGTVTDKALKRSAKTAKK